MKKLLFLLCVAAATHLRAAEFTLRPEHVSELLSVWHDLDGYDVAIDQGPQNPKRIIRINYSFTGDVRKKLAADHRVLLDAYQGWREKIVKLQAEIAEAISGPNARFDDKNSAQVSAITARAKGTLDTLALELSPISADDLKPGDKEGENPIPDSVLTAFALLRAPLLIPAAHP